MMEWRFLRNGKRSSVLRLAFKSMVQRGQRGAIPSPPGAWSTRRTAELLLGGVARRGSRGACRLHVHTMRTVENGKAAAAAAAGPVLARRPSTEIRGRGRKWGWIRGKKRERIEGRRVRSPEEKNGFDTPDPYDGRRFDTTRVEPEARDGFRERERERRRKKEENNKRKSGGRARLGARFYGGAAKRMKNGNSHVIVLCTNVAV